jgi:hypothetical protein
VPTHEAGRERKGVEALQLNKVDLLLQRPRAQAVIWLGCQLECSWLEEGNSYVVFRSASRGRLTTECELFGYSWLQLQVDESGHLFARVTQLAPRFRLAVGPQAGLLRLHTRLLPCGSSSFSSHYYLSV